MIVRIVPTVKRVLGANRVQTVLIAQIVRIVYHWFSVVTVKMLLVSDLTELKINLILCLHHHKSQYLSHEL